MVFNIRTSLQIICMYDTGWMDAQEYYSYKSSVKVLTWAIIMKNRKNRFLNADVRNVRVGQFSTAQKQQHLAQ